MTLLKQNLVKNFQDDPVPDCWIEIAKMTKDKELKALFIMCSDLKKEVKELRAELKELRENRESYIPKAVVENMETLSNSVNDANNYTEEEIARLETDLCEVRDHVKLGEDRHVITVQKIKALEANMLHECSVKRSKPYQFRDRPRICYNCRRPGHEARHCNRPNPRLTAAPDLSEQNAPALSGTTTPAEEAEDSRPQW